MPADPYTTLGVAKNASADEIKKAYRKLAHQYHPDKKGGNEAKFKEVSEAYQILSDPEKKSRYDRFGEMGNNPGFGGGNPFGGQYQDFNFDFGGAGFESIFDMFGGGFGRPSGSAQSRQTKGEDLHLDVHVVKSDFGKRKVYEFDAFDGCKTCHASGIAPGSKMIECRKCQGQGRLRQSVRTPFGTFAQVVTCPDCGGEGEKPEKKCPDCGGTGRMKMRRKLEIHIPEKIADRYLVVFPGEGNAGQIGAPAGDLLVTLRVG